MRAGPRLVAGLALSGLLINPPGLAGQDGAPRAASPELQPATFWWDASLGSGSSQVSCGICRSGFDHGPFVTAAVGAYATTRVSLGLEVGGWTHRHADIRERILQGALSLRYARDPRHGVHFLAGLGWMHYGAGDFGYHAPQIQLGVGWTFPVFDTWGWGTRLLTDVAPFGSLTNGDDTVADGVRVGTVRLSFFVRRN